MAGKTDTNEADLTPFLKWAGGKRWLCRRFPFLFPSDFSRYVEPFLGSGAVLFHVRPERALLSDANKELIATYKAIRRSWRLVHEELSRHARAHSDAYYYEVRAARPTNSISAAAQFLYLNRTCWNGLYRVNLNGIFNVPRGTKDQVLLPTDNFAATAKFLKGKQMQVADFGDTLRETGQGDFAFIDPPYTVAHNLNGFVKYNDNIFTWDDQIRLRDEIVAAARRGAKILMTNADHPSIHTLYDGVGRKFPLDRATIISGDVAGRRGTTELAIAIGYRPGNGPRRANALVATTPNQLVR